MSETVECEMPERGQQQGQARGGEALAPPGVERIAVVLGAGAGAGADDDPDDCGDGDECVWRFSSQFDGNEEWIDVEVCDRPSGWSVEVWHVRAGKNGVSGLVGAPRRIVVQRGGASGPELVGAEPADPLDPEVLRNDLAEATAQVIDLCNALASIARHHGLPPDVSPEDIADYAIEYANMHVDRAHEIVRTCGGEPGADGWREALARVVKERDRATAIVEAAGRSERVVLGQLYDALDPGDREPLWDAAARLRRERDAATEQHYQSQQELSAVVKERDHLQGVRTEQAAKLRRHLEELAELRAQHEDIVVVLTAVEPHLTERLVDDRSAGIEDWELGVAAVLDRVWSALGARVAADVVCNACGAEFDPENADPGGRCPDCDDGVLEQAGGTQPRVAPPAALAAEADRLHLLLDERGVDIPGSLEASYVPGEPAVLALVGVDDRVLFGPVDKDIPFTVSNGAAATSPACAGFVVDDETGDTSGCAYGNARREGRELPDDLDDCPVCHGTGWEPQDGEGEAP
ncbi:MAG: hypothetical protein AMXMBFR64_45440 [Myxococcales bacterium]